MCIRERRLPQALVLHEYLLLSHGCITKICISTFRPGLTCFPLFKVSPIAVILGPTVTRGGAGGAASLPVSGRGKREPEGAGSPATPSTGFRGTRERSPAPKSLQGPPGD